MRLAYLLKKFPRLSETFVLNEILGQEENGLDVSVFSRRAPDDEPRHPQLERLRAAVEVMPSPRGIDPWTALFAAQQEVPDLLTKVEGLIAGNREWGHERFPNLIAEALWLLVRTRELGIEHVHVHFATDSAVTAMILRELGGPTYSITAHAKDIYRNTVSPVLLSRLVAGSEFTVTVCDANVRHLAGLLTPAARERVRRLYNGIDLAAFAGDGAVRTPRHVLGVGRLVEKKGFDVLIDALALLAERGVELTAAIAGDGEERENLARRVRARGLAGRVELTGPLDSDQVRAAMDRASLFCLPCRIGEDGNRDALPTVLLEALAGGLPAISTPVTGIPEILDHGRAGVLVPADDVEATARAIEELLDDPERRASHARSGCARARDLFDREKQAAILAGWFREVAAVSHPRLASEVGA